MTYIDISGNFNVFAVIIKGKSHVETADKFG